MMRGCSWIVGDPAGKDTQFCERPVIGHTNWCVRHYQIVYPHAAVVPEEPDDDDVERDELEQLAVAVGAA